MNETLIPGLEFVTANRLTVREVEVYLAYAAGPKTASQVAAVIQATTTSVYNITSRLKIKKLIELQSKNDALENVYVVSA